MMGNKEKQVIPPKHISEYDKVTLDLPRRDNKTIIKALSLFANVGIAEAYLEKIGINVAVANEIDARRVKFYKHIYPSVNMIHGDITIPKIKQLVITESIKAGVDMIIATPPCQGMSTAGKMEKWDVRNTLICHAVELIQAIRPKYVFLENVPQQLTTQITYNGIIMLIPEYIKTILGNDYIFNDEFIIQAADHGVPQVRERAIMLLVRKDLGVKWVFPEKMPRITLKEAIGDLPSVDPEIYDVPPEVAKTLLPEFETKRQKALKVSKWHYPPKHVYRQVVTMMHTPTGATAFNNIDEYKPRKKDGSLVRGFKNTYKRQDWDQPGYTVTMFNREISSQNNVHPGRKIGKDATGNMLYSDARVMTIYELLIMTSLPVDWNIPDWASDHFIRCVIGEGIPSLLVKKIMEKLLEAINE